MKKIRSILRSAFHRPFLLFTIFSLLMIYKYLPSLFNLLLTSSPTILFTTILLAIVLAYSEPNIPENQNAAYRPNRTRALVVRVREHNPSGESESSKSDESASESEIIPTLDEIHPLLESDLAQSGLESKDVSESEPDSNSDNVSLGEETEVDEVEKAQKVVAWTADDQKNVMSVGSSEIERNTRLEDLIARRKAVRKLLERDLIDLEGMDSSHIQPVIAPRMNPFDLPYEEEVPGSAPSVLLPTAHNPFDITFDEPVVHGQTLPRDNADIASYANNTNINVAASTSINSTTGFGNQDFRRNALYRRHESFTIGAPVVFMDEMKPEPRASRFKPFFIPEVSDGTESYTEKETSERSDVHDESSAERKFSIAQDALSESYSSDKSVRDPKKIEEDEEFHESSVVEGDKKRAVGSSSSSSDTESDHETVSSAEDLGRQFSLKESEFTEFEAHKAKIKYQPQDSDVQHTVEAHTAEPVYDSSPSAHDMLDDSLFDANSKSTARELTATPGANSSEGVWVAPSMASVEEMESRSREVSEICERDIIGARLSKIHGALSHSIVPMLPNQTQE